MCRACPEWHRYYEIARSSEPLQGSGAFGGPVTQGSRDAATLGYERKPLRGSSDPGRLCSSQAIMDSGLESGSPSRSVAINGVRPPHAEMSRIRRPAGGYEGPHSRGAGCGPSRSWVVGWVPFRWVRSLRLPDPGGITEISRGSSKATPPVTRTQTMPAPRRGA
jgi:hypothetical protein